MNQQTNPRQRAERGALTSGASAWTCTDVCVEADACVEAERTRMGAN